MRIAMYPSRAGRSDNPFIAILSAALRDVGVRIVPVWRTPGVIHVHWLEQVFWGRVSRRIPGGARLRAWHLLRAARKVRARGGRVVWTVHNLAPHEPPQGAKGAVWAGLVEAFVPLVTDAILMSGAARQAVLESYPGLADARIHVIPHPHYRDFFDGLAIPPKPARPPDRVPTLAMVGRLRPYKGIPDLVSRLRQRQDARFRLIIAGAGSSGHRREILAAIGGDPRFELVAREVSHRELAAILRDSDLAVFNFRTVLNSGSVLTALSLDTPVACPDEPVFRELAARVGTDWVRCFRRPLDIDWLLAQAAESASLAGRAAPLAAFSPAHVGKIHRALYERG